MRVCEKGGERKRILSNTIADIYVNIVLKYQVETLEMESALETRRGCESISTRLEMDERWEFI